MAMKKQLNNAGIAFFCDRLALTIQAGLPPEEGLSFLDSKEIGTKAAAAAKEIRSGIEQGKSLSLAIEECHRFPAYVVEMVRIGEAAGRLEEVFMALSSYYEESYAVEKNIKNAVLYPAIMALMILAVLTVLVVKVLPVFADVYRALGSEISGPAAGLLSVGTAISQNTIVITVVLAVLLLIVLLSVCIPGMRQFWIRHGKRLFAETQKILIKGRFASSLSLMMKSGMDLDESLTLAMALIDDKSFCQKITAAQDLMSKEGQSFPRAMRSAELFSNLQSAMLEMGFLTGKTDEVMERIAKEYEEEAGDRISRFVGAIEPTIVALLSIMVGLVLLSVILPLMGVMTSL